MELKPEEHSGFYNTLVDKELEAPREDIERPSTGLKFEEACWTLKCGCPLRLISLFCLACILLVSSYVEVSIPMSLDAEN